MRYLTTLEEKGWIVDLTPGRRNSAHVYQVTSQLARLGHSTPQAGGETRPGGSTAVTEDHPTPADGSLSGIRNPLAEMADGSGSDAQPIPAENNASAGESGDPARVTDSPLMEIGNPPAGTMSHPTVTGGPPGGTGNHSGGDSPSLPAATASHLNQTLKRDSLCDNGRNAPTNEQEEEEDGSDEWRLVQMQLKVELGPTLMPNGYRICARRASMAPC